MGVSMIQATEKAALNAEAAITLAKYVKENRLEASRELHKLEQEVKANQAKAAVIQGRMTELAAGTSRNERDAVIVVDRGNAGAAGKVRLSYLVDQASWRPQYKFRAGKALKDPVQVEFLASPDDWFRPVNLTHGPEGAMYVVDMVRAVIEHPEFMPPELKNRPDLTLGKEKGRIWRIVPEGYKHTASRSALGKATTTELVQLLEHKEPWYRTTAQRLLIQRHHSSGTFPVEAQLEKLRPMTGVSRFQPRQRDASFAQSGDRFAAESDRELVGLFRAGKRPR